MTGLKARRTAARISRQQLGDALGVSRQAVGKWETGAAWPSAYYLPRLAGILGCSIEELYAEEEDPSPAAQDDRGPGRPDEGIRPYAEEDGGSTPSPQGGGFDTDNYNQEVEI